MSSFFCFSTRPADGGCDEDDKEEKEDVNDDDNDDEEDDEDPNAEEVCDGNDVSASCAGAVLDLLGSLTEGFRRRRLFS